MKIPGALLIGLLLASPAAAQPGPTLGAFAVSSVRPYLLLSGQQFAAEQTFNASFGDARGLFWGGGLEVDFAPGLFVDLAVSRFRRTGQNAFISGGQVFQLGTPETVTVVPIEATAGYRFAFGPRSPLTPYVGIGGGSYEYEQTYDAANADENVDTRHAGILFLAGLDVRVQRLVRVSADVQDTRIKGILGTNPLSLSGQANEDDLGGIAARLRILIGR